jgi:hypothetical protein
VAVLFWRLSEPSDSKIWYSVTWDSEPRITVLARTTSNLAGVVAYSEQDPWLLICVLAPIITIIFVIYIFNIIVTIIFILLLLSRVIGVCDYRRGVDWKIEFIDTLYTPLGTTHNYSAIVDLHTWKFAVTHTLGFAVFTSRILATDFNTVIIY